MNRTRNILRGAFILLIVVILIHLIRTTDRHTGTIAKLKLETFNKIKADSLGALQRLDTLVGATRELSVRLGEDSEKVRSAVYQLSGALALALVSEIFFAMASRRRT